MGKQSAPQPPNLQPVSDAQVQIAQMNNQLAQKYLGLSQQQFDFLKQNASQELTFAQQQAQQSFGLQQQALDTQKGIEAAASKVSDAQLAAMQTAEGYAAQDRARYENTFVPLQDQMVKFAKDYASPARQETAAGQAIGDVATAANQQRQNANLQLESMGVDPSQVQSASLLSQLGVGTAANEAMAGNQARIQTQMQGQQLLGNAVNMGAGLPSQVNASMGAGTNSGNSAVGAAGAGQQGALNAMGSSINYGGSGLSQLGGAIQGYSAATGSPMQWANFGGNLSQQAMAGYNSAANTMTSQFNSGLAASNANNATSASEFSNVLGGAAMIAMMAGGGVVDGSQFGQQPSSQWTQAIPTYLTDPSSGSYTPPNAPSKFDFATQSGGSDHKAFDWRAHLQAGLQKAAMAQKLVHAPNYQQINPSQNMVPTGPGGSFSIGDGAVAPPGGFGAMVPMYRAGGGLVDTNYGSPQTNAPPTGLSPSQTGQMGGTVPQGFSLSGGHASAGGGDFGGTIGSTPATSGQGAQQGFMGTGGMNNRGADASGQAAAAGFNLNSVGGGFQPVGPSYPLGNSVSPGVGARPVFSAPNQAIPTGAGAASMPWNRGAQPHAQPGGMVQVNGQFMPQAQWQAQQQLVQQQHDQYLRNAATAGSVANTAWNKAQQSGPGSVVSLGNGNQMWVPWNAQSGQANMAGAIEYNPTADGAGSVTPWSQMTAAQQQALQANGLGHADLRPGPYNPNDQRINQYLSSPQVAGETMSPAGYAIPAGAPQASPASLGWQPNAQQQVGTGAQNGTPQTFGQLPVSYFAGGGPVEPVGQQAADLEDRPLEWNRMFPQYSAAGGPVPVRQSVDRVPAILAHGEYVIPRDVVQSKGIEFFDRLVKKYHRPGA